MSQPITIPCLSLWQIWAAAMSAGVKKVETRDDNQISRTKYRGDIAIHAAKKKWSERNEDEELVEQVITDRIGVNIVYGAVLCIVELYEITSTEKAMETIGAVEEVYGNYADGRKALWTRNLRVLPSPVYMNGHQGWFPWTVPAEYQHLVQHGAVRVLDFEGGK